MLKDYLMEVTNEKSVKLANPILGFKSLNPKLTVVKKQPSMQHEHPDEYLPSVMTYD